MLYSGQGKSCMFVPISICMPTCCMFVPISTCIHTCKFQIHVVSMNFFINYFLCITIVVVWFAILYSVNCRHGVLHVWSVTVHLCMYGMAASWDVMFLQIFGVPQATWKYHGNRKYSILKTYHVFDDELALPFATCAVADVQSAQRCLVPCTPHAVIKVCMCVQAYAYVSMYEMKYTYLCACMHTNHALHGQFRNPLLHAKFPSLCWMMKFLPNCEWVLLSWLHICVWFNYVKGYHTGQRAVPFLHFDAL